MISKSTPISQLPIHNTTKEDEDAIVTEVFEDLAAAIPGFDGASHDVLPPPSVVLEQDEAPLAPPGPPEHSTPPPSSTEPTRNLGIDLSGSAWRVAVFATLLFICAHAIPIETMVPRVVLMHHHVPTVVRAVLVGVVTWGLCVLVYDQT